MKIIDKIESEQLKKEVPQFKVGDTVKVSVRVKEGDKERVQAYAGLVIAREGRGLNESFTVRRISYGEGVERKFPLHSPFLEKIIVEKAGRVRRAKLYYLRSSKGQMVVKEDRTAALAASARKAARKKAAAAAS
jgi:large subunit ribosomal protein L19